MRKSNFIVFIFLVFITNAGFAQTDLVYDDSVKTVNQLLKIDNEIAIKSARDKVIGGAIKTSVIPANPLPPSLAEAFKIHSGIQQKSDGAFGKMVALSIYGNEILYADLVKDGVTADSLTVGDKFQGCVISKISKDNVTFKDPKNCPAVLWRLATK